MINDIIQNAEANMHKAIESFKIELGKLRTGRAHPSLVEGVRVDYYGTDTPLKNIASVVASDAKTLTITPWEKAMVNPIAKAITMADLGLNPISDATLIRVPLPSLTEERRKELVKVVKVHAEQAKVAVRNIRRDANNALEALLKSKQTDEDNERRAQDNVQKITDKFVVEIDKIATTKETDLLSI